jgi:hypothetical protein
MPTRATSGQRARTSAHFLHRHRHVGLVLQGDDAPPAGLLAHDAVEGDDRARRAGRQPALQAGFINRLARDLENVFAHGCTLREG